VSKECLAKLRIVRPKRIYEQVAEQLAQLIKDGSFPPGSRLPAERELTVSLGVSRPSLREAMIGLEVLGLIETRVGDGTYVAREFDYLALNRLASMDLGPSAVEQFQVRRTLETECAGLAAEAAGAENLDGLRRLLEEMQAAIAQGRNPWQLHKRFHNLLAGASGNQLLASMIHTLWVLREGELWSGLRARVDHPVHWQRGLESRRRLLTALENRDARASRVVMTEHFEALSVIYFGGPDDASDVLDTPA